MGVQAQLDDVQQALAAALVRHLAGAEAPGSNPTTPTEAPARA
jgi:hypothetical protein